MHNRGGASDASPPDTAPTVTEWANSRTLKTHYAVVGSGFSVVLPEADTGSGNGGPYTYELLSRSDYSDFDANGLSFDPVTRTFSGTPTAPQTHKLAYRIHDGDANRAAGDAVIANLQIVVQPKPQPQPQPQIAVQSQPPPPQQPPPQQPPPQQPPPQQPEQERQEQPPSSQQPQQERQEQPSSQQPYPQRSANEPWYTTYRKQEYSWRTQCIAAGPKFCTAYESVKDDENELNHSTQQWTGSAGGACGVPR